MTRIQRIAPHGSGPLSARGRAALWQTLEPLLPQACHDLRLGTFVRATRVEHGSHHLVWKVLTDRGVFAIRPGARTRSQTDAVHKSRERLWRLVGRSGIAPAYHDSLSLRLNGFSGWLEAFTWIDSRMLNPSSDASTVAAALAKLHRLPRRGIRSSVPHITLLPFLQAELRAYQRLSSGGGAVNSLLRRKTVDALASLRVVPSGTLKSCLVHNDLVDRNVLIQKGQTWLIDWDWALVASPVVDLFCFLSPFVRSWRANPRYMTLTAAERFLQTYAQGGGRHRIAKELRSSGAQWNAYNVLLANWLRHGIQRPPHRMNASFFRKAFDEVDRLSAVLVSFK